MAFSYYGNNYPQGYGQPQNPPYTQNNTLIRVKSEAEMLNYPLAPGVSGLFYDENAQVLYSKTMDISQLGGPKVEKYKLTKVEMEGQPPEPQYATVNDLLAVREDLIKLLGEKVAELKTDNPVTHIDTLLEQGEVI